MHINGGGGGGGGGGFFIVSSEGFFVESAQNLTGEISGQAQSLACNGHPSIL